MPERARGSGGSVGGEVAEGDAAAAGGPRLRPAGPSARPASSAMEFQAPQASQRPDHLAWVAPQAVQAKAGRRVIGSKRVHAAGERGSALRPADARCRRSRACTRLLAGTAAAPGQHARMQRGCALRKVRSGQGHRTVSIGPSARPWMNWSR